MKNKLLVLGAMVCLLAILAAGTLAYFTTTAVTHNVITTGEIDISIVETVPEGTPIRDKDGNITGYQILDIMPDKTVTKKVTIHNDAQEPAWIRVKLNHTIVDKNKEPLSTQENNVDMVQYRGTSDKWIQSGDWYYYNEPVAGGADTEPVLEEVYFAAEMGNAYQECTVTLSVEAEAVQSKNNPIPAGGKVTDIPGWPTA